MKGYVRYTWFVFLMVFLVITAGGVVRMTHSGMGCPDWPTCFGRWIPPINESQLPEDYQKYLSKQDIDTTFNPFRTWVEYINRLLGALLGLTIIGHFIWTLKLFWRTRKDLVGMSFLLLVFVIFEGWLGKTVVDANLDVSRITLHMLGAIVLYVIPLIIITRFMDAVKINKLTLSLIWAALLTSLGQILIGTRVRESIDVIAKSYDYIKRDQWMSEVADIFYVHRSFSWVIFILGIILLFKVRKIPQLVTVGWLQLMVLFVIIALGVIMNYLNIPAFAQPLHLILANLYFALLSYILFKVKI